MGRRGHGWTVGGVVAVAMASLTVGAAPALASGTVSYVRQFGASGSSSGDLNVAGGMAVDNATGGVYVADNDNDRIDEFDSSGNFVKAWGAGVADGSSTTYQTCTTACRQGVASGSAGGLNRPQDIAIDGSGNLFVADSANGRVDEFDTSGNFEKAWGWGVADGQQQFETCTTTCQSGISNTGAGALSAPFGVAVTPSGDVVVGDYGNSRVSEFDPSGSPVAFVRAWGSGGAGASQFDGLTGIGVDSSSGDVYAVDSLNYRVQQFTATGGFIRAWGWGVADGQSQFETCGDAGAGCQSGIFGSGTGQFASPIRVASGVVVDPTGAVDVIDVDNNRVQQFSKGGSFANMFGWGVGDGQNQFENCTSGCQGGKSGTGAGQLWGPSGIATDSAGHLYVDNGGWIEVYSSTVAAATHRLTAAAAGSGSGTVTSSAAGIDCGNACSAPFDAGAHVTLTAAPDSGSSFTGWSGGGCSGTGTCTVTLAQDTTVTATFASTGCGDTFTGSSGGDWGTAANWSAGVPGSSTVACWSGKTVVVSGESATAASVQGGDLSIGTSGFLTLASSSGSSSVTGLSIGGGSLDGPSGATLSIDGDVTWSGGASQLNGGAGSALAISQTAGHSLTIGGTAQQLFDGGSIQTDSPVSISDPHFAGANAPSLTTTSTVTFAPGSYDANGNAGTRISAAGMVTSGDTALPNFALHLTGATTTIPSGRTVSAGSIAVDGGTLQGDGTISGNLTNTGGTVAPGDSPGTLVVTGNYTQQGGGTLAIAVNSTTAGSGYSVLSVGGNVNLGGTLDLNPSTSYASGAQTGDTIGFLTYAGSRTGQFATTTVNPPLAGGRPFTADYGTANVVNAIVGASTTEHTLTVTKSGSGGGTVTSAPAGINCGSTCSADFGDGTKVTLTAAHQSGSTFAGWSGGGCSGTQPTCTITMSAAEAVGAEFDQSAPAAPTGLSASPVSSSEIDLSWNAVSGATGYVVKRGTSPGGPYTQAGAPSGAAFADSGLSASTTYYYVVQATNAGGRSPNSAEASATTETTVNAAGGPSTLTVAKAGSGAGTISSTPAGIDCGSTCSAQFANGTQVTLTAAPGAGSLFAGWGGGGCSGTSSCTVTVNGSATVTAGFEPAGGLVPPPGAVVAVRAPSARPGVVGSLLVLNPKRRRATVALLCRARAGSSCKVTGKLRRRGATLGTVAGRLPGQRIGTLPIHLSSAAHALPPTPQRGSLVLTNSAPGLGTAHLVQPVTLQKQVPAGQPPLVTTEMASDIVPVDYSGSGAAGSAVIAGTVNPRGLATRYHFEVGPAPGLYNTDLPASDASAGHGELTQLETARVPNLGNPGPTHYRIVAESAGGIAYGPDRSFTLPIATPGPGIAPLPPSPASTVAGVVQLSLSEQCTPLGDLVTGGVIQCTIQAADPQPPAVDVGVGTVPVPSVSTVLDAVAPPGTAINVTGAPDQAFPMVLNPSAGATVAAVSFRVEHPPDRSLNFELTDGFDAPAVAIVRAPEQPRVSMSVNCTPGRPGAKSSASAFVAPGSPVTCKITTRNGGFDAADFSTFSIAPKADLVDPTTVAGGPPAVIEGALVPSTTTIELRVSPTAHAGAKLSVAVAAAGSDETDRAPFFVNAVSNDLTVRRQR